VLVAITFAPGTTAPLLSVTVPEMVPSPAVWAWSATGFAIDNATAHTKSVLQTMLATLLALEFMMTSIEIASMDKLPGHFFACAALDVRQE
jgi:hypothetical protein